MTYGKFYEDLEMAIGCNVKNIESTEITKDLASSATMLTFVSGKRTGP